MADRRGFAPLTFPSTGGCSDWAELTIHEMVGWLGVAPSGAEAAGSTGPPAYSNSLPTREMVDLDGDAPSAPALSSRRSADELQVVKWWTDSVTLRAEVACKASLNPCSRPMARRLGAAPRHWDLESRLPSCGATYEIGPLPAFRRRSGIESGAGDRSCTDTAELAIQNACC
jgi:hypothetical protein